MLCDPTKVLVSGEHVVSIGGPQVTPVQDSTWAEPRADCRSQAWDEATVEGGGSDWLSLEAGCGRGPVLESLGRGLEQGEDEHVGLVCTGALCHVVCAAPSLASDPSQRGWRPAHPTAPGWAIKDQVAFRGPSPSGDRSSRVLTSVSVAFLTGV